MQKGSIRSKRFVDKLTRIVHENFTNGNFSIASLADLIGVSRSQLYYMVKRITDKSVSQFVREVRLNEAMIMLQRDEDTVSEIAYKVGFNSPSYFNTCFRANFGYSPGSVRNLVLNRYEAGLKSTSGILDEQIKSASVAVLPFKSLSDRPEQSYFTDGLSESILHLLAQIDGLKVPAWTSSEYYRDYAGDLSPMGDNLGVSHVLEGSVHQVDNNIRVTTQLVRTDNNYHVLSLEFNRELGDVFAIIDEISEQVVGAIKKELLDTVGYLKYKNISTQNVAALDNYYKGLHELEINTRESILKAESQFKAALQIDENFNLARIGLINTYLAMTFYGMMQGYHGWREPAEIMAREILSREPKSATALATLALIEFSRDVPEGNGKSDILFRQALEAEPRNPHILERYAYFLNFNDQPLKSIEMLETALIANPMSPGILANAARHGRLEHAKTLRRIHPGNPEGWSAEAEVLLAKNKLSEAYRLFQISEKKDPNNPTYSIYRTMVLTTTGLLESAEETLNQSHVKSSTAPIKIAAEIALARQKGNHDQAGEMAIAGLYNGLWPQDFSPFILCATALDMTLRKGHPKTFIEAIDQYHKRDPSKPITDYQDPKVVNLLDFVYKSYCIPVYQAMGDESTANKLLNNFRSFYDKGSNLLKYAWGFELHLYSGNFDKALDALENILDPEKHTSLCSTRYKLNDVPFPWKWFLVYQSEITAPLNDNLRYKQILNKWDSLIDIESEKLKNIISQ